jgi:hypothetical protein
MIPTRGYRGRASWIRGDFKMKFLYHVGHIRRRGTSSPAHLDFITSAIPDYGEDRFFAAFAGTAPFHQGRET